MDIGDGRICCNVYGYSSNISKWFEKTVEVFSENDFFLKSVS